MTIVLTTLHKYTNYTLKVAAYTRIGTGENSKQITCCTEQDGIRTVMLKLNVYPRDNFYRLQMLLIFSAPGPPEDIKIAVASAQSLTVAWSPPKYSNGILLRYNLYTR